MKITNIILGLFLTINVYTSELFCMGNSNANELIQVKVDLDPRLGKVLIEGSENELSISNEFMYVWQNKFENQVYTNTLSRIDGSLTVIAENSGPENEPILRAILSCKERKNLLFK